MSGATVTTASPSLAKTYQPVVAKTFYTGTPILTMFPPKPGKGGRSIDFFIHSAGNTSGETFSEGQATPVSGYQTKVAATRVYKSFRTMVKISGELRDAAGSGDNYYNAVESEFKDGTSDLMHLVEEGLMASLTDGIDDSTTYAGVNRSNYNLSAAMTTLSSEALSTYHLEEAWEDTEVDPRSVDKSDFMIVSAPEQMTAYGRSASDLGGINVNKDLGSGPLDTGRMQAGAAFNTAPWFKIATLTNTLVLGFRKSHILVEEKRPINIRPMGIVDDDDEYQLSWRGELVVINPYHTFRIEGLTT